MLRIAIVGCGKIADQHAEHITALKGCCLVAVCDREPLMAAQLADRYGVPNRYTDLGALLAEAKPDVVHLTTPPQAHFSMAKQCLEAGCHIYVEKPFTVTSAEAEDLIALAERQRVRLTVGHHAQFSHAAREMRSLVAAGYLGGPPVHLESYYCYDLGDPAYARALLGDPYHWVRALPGALLQNTISHGISKIAEFLPSPRPQVFAYGFTSATLQSIGEYRIIDELRTIIHDGPTTAYFTFSSQMRPSLHQLRIYGPKNGLVLDEQQQTLIRLRGQRYKSYLEKFLPPYQFARQYAANVARNVRLFARNDFHEGHGMRKLIDAFYHSVRSGGPIPIPYPEILRTARIMDDIFDQLADRGPSLAEPAPPVCQERS